MARSASGRQHHAQQRFVVGLVRQHHFEHVVGARVETLDEQHRRAQQPRWNGRTQALQQLAESLALRAALAVTVHAGAHFVHALLQRHKTLVRQQLAALQQLAKQIEHRIGRLVAKRFVRVVKPRDQVEQTLAQTVGLGARQIVFRQRAYARRQRIARFLTIGVGASLLALRRSAHLVTKRFQLFPLFVQPNSLAPAFHRLISTLNATNRTQRR